MEEKENYTYEGFEVSIYYSDAPDDPRAEWDHESVLYSNHRYLNPDNCNIDELMGKYGVNDIESLCEHLDKDYIWTKVYMYEHSGIALSTTPFNGMWDTGLLGILTVEKSKVRECFNKKRISKKLEETVLSMLNSEVDIYGAYLEGEVYGYAIYDAHGEEIDSCGGYYGYEGMKILKEDVKDFIDKLDK